MGKIVKILSTSIKNNKLISKILGLGSSDSKTPYNAMPPGVDSRPIKGMKAVFMSTTNDKEPVLVGYINENCKAAEGEIRLYSVDSNGAEKTYLHLKNDGLMELAGNADFAVRFSELESGFNQLKSDFNSFITATYNTHTHVTPAGPSAKPLPVGTSSAASIAGAKISEIKVP